MKYLKLFEDINVGYESISMSDYHDFLDVYVSVEYTKHEIDELFKLGAKQYNQIGYYKGNDTLY